MLHDTGADLRHIMDLPDKHPGRLRIAQARAAPAAGVRDVVQDLVGVGHHLQAAPSAPGCLPGLRVVPLRLPRFGVTNRSADGGNDEFCEFCPNRRDNYATCSTNAAI